MNNVIKVGDTVKVVDWERAFSTYSDWFLERMNKLKPEWLVRYAFDENNYENHPLKGTDNRRWKVLFIDDDQVLITELPELLKGAVYLINLKGLSL